MHVEVFTTKPHWFRHTKKNVQQHFSIILDRLSVCQLRPISEFRCDIPTIRWYKLRESESVMSSHVVYVTLLDRKVYSVAICTSQVVWVVSEISVLWMNISRASSDHCLHCNRVLLLESKLFNGTVLFSFIGNSLVSQNVVLVSSWYICLMSCMLYDTHSIPSPKVIRLNHLWCTYSLFPIKINLRRLE